MAADGYSAKERRFALLVLLHTEPATVQEALRLPAYGGQVDAAAGSAIRRTFERDVEALRESGYNIYVDRAGRYVLDDSSNIVVDGSEVDVGILASILASHAQDRTDQTLRSGVNKLLSTGVLRKHKRAVLINTPTGEAVTQIAPAIQLGRRVKFDYRPLWLSAPRTYTVEPWRIQVHYQAFYLHGLQLEGGKPAGPRVYKLDRIAGPVSVLPELIKFPVGEVDSQFAPVNAQLRVLRTTPLGRRVAGIAAEGGEATTRADSREAGAAAESESPQWVDVTLTGVDRAELFDDLMFYGLDARLVGPPELVADLRARLEHLANLGGERSGAGLSDARRAGTSEGSASVPVPRSNGSNHASSNGADRGAR